MIVTTTFMVFFAFWAAVVIAFLPWDWECELPVMLDGSSDDDDSGKLDAINSQEGRKKRPCRCGKCMAAARKKTQLPNKSPVSQTP